VDTIFDIAGMYRALLCSSKMAVCDGFRKLEKIERERGAAAPAVCVRQPLSFFSLRFSSLAALFFFLAQRQPGGVVFVFLAQRQPGGVVFSRSLTS
jgi:hypothetical protein